MARKARTPRATDKKELSPAEIREGFQDLFPQIDLDALLADPSNKEATRVFDAAVSKKLLVETVVRAFKSRKNGEPVPFHLEKLPRLLRLDAELAGNLGERVVEVPAQPLARLRAILGLEEHPEQALQLIEAVTAPKEEKVIHVTKSGS